MEQAGGKHQASYGHDALGTHLAHGVTHLEIWCTGRDALGRICANRQRIALPTLIEKHGPATPMIMLARRYRCAICGHLGAHIQPASPPAFGMPGHREWLDGQLRWAAEFLKTHGWL